jgi:hypothetical protein
MKYFRYLANFLLMCTIHLLCTSMGLVPYSRNAEQEQPMAKTSPNYARRATEEKLYPKKNDRGNTENRHRARNTPSAYH